MNQYAKAREQGLKPGDDGWPTQAETRPPMHERTKAKISHTKRVQIAFDKAMDALERVIDEGKSESAVVAAAGKVLDKVVPTMSSVDSTLVNKNENMSEEQLIARLRVLVESNPELVSKVLGDHARSNKQLKEADAA